MKKTTILVVDDHKLIRETWKSILDMHASFEVVATCATAEEAINLVKEHSPQVALLDINLPGMSGLEAIALIRKYSPGTKIIGVSMHTQLFYIREMMKLGASAYVTKNSSKEELIIAINEVIEGKKYICSEIRHIVAEQLCNENSEPEKSINHLSRREIEIVELLKNGCSSKEIGALLCISAKTVEVHRCRILKKLDLKNTPALINFLHKHWFGRG
jgi:DNA-binding NarL/FixJ family response regulator